jgi:hypothetical protein
MSDALSDVFGSNPDRPDHPDFWRMSDVRLMLDGRTQNPDISDEERQKSFAELYGDAADIESISYLAFMRTRAAFGLEGAAKIEEAFASLMGKESSRLTTEQRTKVMALYMEAFVTGVEFQKRGGHQEK